MVKCTGDALGKGYGHSKNSVPSLLTYFWRCIGRHLGRLSVGSSTLRHFRAGLSVSRVLRSGSQRGGKYWFYFCFQHKETEFDNSDLIKS